MAAQQAPPSLEFSRQEHWSGLPFPSPMHESEVAQSCPTLSDPMDCNLPGSSIHGIFQARVLEWGAIAFSNTGGPRTVVGEILSWEWGVCLSIELRAVHQVIKERRVYPDSLVAANVQVDIKRLVLKHW